MAKIRCGERRAADYSAIGCCALGARARTQVLRSGTRERSRAVHPERKRRFIQEARAASALNHPNIVVIYGIDSWGGTDFMAVEYVDGEGLDCRIGGRALPIAEVLHYAARIAAALGAAHAAGIVHRDIKPANIMVSREGVIKVLDFGLAKLTEPPSADS